MRSLFDQAEAAFGGVDVLVNNAGVMGTALMIETDDESFDHHIAVNLKGTFYGMRIDELADLSPLGRLGTPDDIARVVSFLAGPDGAWVNGQILRVNGGAI